MTEFDKYFKALQAHSIADITEHSHRSNLQQLLESLAGTKVKILHEPKREGKFGSPDFKVTATESIIGYVENKKIEENLDKILKSDQIKKYQALSDNILITNYIDWIWIKEGKIQQRETLCFLTDIEDKRKKLENAKITSVEKLIKSFFSQAPKEITDAKKLAEALAIRAKLLKDFLLDELKRQEQEHTEGRLYQLYETFRTFVFHELTISEFSDAFAQNLVYGLFLAKLNADVKQVNLNNAWDYIPSSFELIKELVDFLKELKRDEYRETKWIVEEVLTIMNNLDLRAIQDSLSFNKRRKDADDLTIKDPYIYFYENFLTAYDKDLREKKGVYYTPPPVVNFIVRGINDILKSTFGIKEGFADRKKVTVLDFATGTGTFLLEILQQIFETLPKDSGKKQLIIKEHILKNIFGFEYLIAPYTIAHIKLSQFLKDNGYELKAKERLQIYLTNTLEPIPAQIKIPLLPALTEESKHAQEIKDKQILVITGNPPYSGHSKNNGEWISDKIKDYYFVDGKPLGEKNPKWLQDDYVKFIRFAQDKMETVEEGVVGIITNHSYLDNPTFRGMRQSLMKTFDQIYLIDLHGNAKKKEKTPDGNKDENVFDIEQGVAISIFVKKKGLDKKIVHSDLWGKRIDKYSDCLSSRIKTVEWNKLSPSTPYYFFFPQNTELKGTYEKFFALNNIYKKYSVGPNSHRDSFAVAFSLEEAKQRVKDLNNKKLSDDDVRKKYEIPDTRDWKLSDARKLKFSEVDILPCLYRPFDKRFMLYGKFAFDYHRPEINDILQQGVLGLITTRQTKEAFSVLITNTPVGQHKLSTPYDGSYIFPLMLPDYGENNFSSDFNQFIENSTLKKFSETEILGYIYAILHSPTYRSKYSEFLKIDFPRIPFTNDKKVFKQLSALGEKLIQVHLLNEEADNPFGVFIGKGNNMVEKPNYIEEKKSGKLYINQTQYFDNVPPEIYEFHIGGYQVLKQYIQGGKKDSTRKGRELSYDEVDNISATIKALGFTIDQIKKIDTLTKNWI